MKKSQIAAADGKKRDRTYGGRVEGPRGRLSGALCPAIGLGGLPSGTH